MLWRGGSTPNHPAPMDGNVSIVREKNLLKKMQCMGGSWSVHGRGQTCLEDEVALGCNTLVLWDSLVGNAGPVLSV